MDRGRRLVDLDPAGSCVDEAFELDAQDRHERRRGRVPVRVDLAWAGPESAGQRVRTRQRHLQRAVGAGDRIPVLADDAEAVGCRDRLEHFESVLLVVGTGAEPSIGRKCSNAGEVVVELRREEAGAAHLAVAHHVDAGVFLVTQRHIDRVVEHLREVHRAEFAAFGGGETRDEPRRASVRTDHARPQSLGHGAPPPWMSANAKARAGLRTNSRSRLSASSPRSSIRAVNPSSSHVSPGWPP